MSNLSKLPEIKLVRHAKATRLKLRVEPTQIRLTVPIFCTKKQIQKFVNDSEQWLIETWNKQQEKIAINTGELPSELKLFNLDHPLEIIYKTQKQSFIFDDENLKLYISDRQPETYLKSFTIEYAKIFLPKYLNKVSREIGLNFEKCNIRQPKTRWGSCTSKHDIMLNSGLVLFPIEITRYVCIHELAHTEHFDHSPKFWKLVELYDINYVENRKKLKSSPLPYWWFTS